MIEKILQLQRQRLSFVVCTIVESLGSTPRKAGTKMLVTANNTFGTIGGGDLEFKVINIAREILAQGNPKLIEFKLEKDLKMACGGKIKIFFEPYLPSPQLILFGAGHISFAIAKILNDSDFKITVIDERNGIFDNWQNLNCKKINKNFKEVIPQLIFDKNTFICSLSHTHSYDLEIVKLCINKPWKYLGVIASKRKAAKIRKSLIDNNFNITKINKIDMPSGIDINCETPLEIAVAIAAKIIDIKNKPSE